jgi:hypothetical protein
MAIPEPAMKEIVVCKAGGKDADCKAHDKRISELIVGAPSRKKIDTRCQESPYALERIALGGGHLSP